MKPKVKTERQAAKDRRRGLSNDPDIVETYEFLAIEQALDRVRLARKAQMHHFGQGELWDDGTGSAEFAQLYGEQRRENTRARNMGQLTWRHVIMADVFSALAEPNPDVLRAKVANLAATAIAWVEALETPGR